MNKKEKQLMADVPLMFCHNRAEFNQRLQWLSEGMLEHNMKSGGWPPNQEEIEMYHRYKKELE